MMLPILKRAGWFGSSLMLSAAILSRCKSPQESPKAQPGSQPPTQTNPVPAALPHGPLPPSDSADSMKPGILEWDAVSKEYSAKTGEAKAPFTFNLTNVSGETVTIYDTSTSCDCTVADLPFKPWALPAGGTGQIHATIDLKGRSGGVTNYVIVFTSKGNRKLNVKAIAP